MIAEAQEAGQAPTVQWYSLAEAKRMLEYKVAALPGGASHWFVPRAACHQEPWGSLPSHCGTQSIDRGTKVTT